MSKGLAFSKNSPGKIEIQEDLFMTGKRIHEMLGLIKGNFSFLIVLLKKSDKLGKRQQIF